MLMKSFTENLSLLIGYPVEAKDFRIGCQGELVYNCCGRQEVLFTDRGDCFDWSIIVKSNYLDSYDISLLALYIDKFEAIANYLYDLKEEGITPDMIEGITNY